MSDILGPRLLSLLRDGPPSKASLWGVVGGVLLQAGEWVSQQDTLASQEETWVGVNTWP